MSLIASENDCQALSNAAAAGASSDCSRSSSASTFGGESPKMLVIWSHPLKTRSHASSAARTSDLTGEPPLPKVASRALRALKRLARLAVVSSRLGTTGVNRAALVTNDVATDSGKNTGAANATDVGVARRVATAPTDR